MKASNSDGKLLCTIPGSVYVITLVIDFGTELGSLDEYFDGSNNGTFKGLLIGDSLVYTNGKVIGSDKVRDYLVVK